MSLAGRLARAAQVRLETLGLVDRQVSPEGLYTALKSALEGALAEEDRPDERYRRAEGAGSCEAAGD